MYSRKPKDMTKFMVGINAAQALHTWEYADKLRLSQVGSTGTSLSVEQRKQRDAQRKVVGRYQNSKIATIATTSRGEVAQFTTKEREKREQRFEKKRDMPAPPPRPSLSDRPMPDASLYRRPGL